MLDWIELIPFSETRNYVQRVLENVVVYRALAGVAAPHPLAFVSAVKWIVSLGGVGFLRPAPGTWGSAVVLPIAWAGPAACAGLLAVVLLALGLVGAAAAAGGGS